VRDIAKDYLYMARVISRHVYTIHRYVILFIFSYTRPTLSERCCPEELFPDLGRYCEGICPSIYLFNICVCIYIYIYIYIYICIYIYIYIYIYNICVCIYIYIYIYIYVCIYVYIYIYIS